MPCWKKKKNTEKNSLSLLQRQKWPGWPKLCSLCLERPVNCTAILVCQKKGVAERCPASGRRQRLGPRGLQLWAEALAWNISIFLLLMKQMGRWFSHRSTLWPCFTALSWSALVIEQGEAIGWNRRLPLSLILVKCSNLHPFPSASPPVLNVTDAPVQSSALRSGSTGVDGPPHNRQSQPISTGPHCWCFASVIYHL